nr:hypothetical protein [Candidatus Sigynarchaeota archaeon]
MLDFLATMISNDIFGIRIGYGGVLDFFALLLPIFVGLTALLGYYDGKNRYKKVKTQFLSRKILLGCIYFVVAVLIPIVHFGSSMGTNIGLVIIEGALIFAAVTLAGMLGMIGRELNCHAVPRGHEIDSR